MIKTILRAAVILSIAATPALAGDKFMKSPDGSKLTIKCKNSGCTVREKKPGGKWATIEKGPGGVDNFNRTVSAYSAKGYK